MTRTSATTGVRRLATERTRMLDTTIISTPTTMALPVITPLRVTLASLFRVLRAVALGVRRVIVLHRDRLADQLFDCTQVRPLFRIAQRHGLPGCARSRGSAD